MATSAQFAANQANAQHSTGPRTDQGKATVRQHLESALCRHMSKLAQENPDLDSPDLQSLAVETLGQTAGSRSTSYCTWLRYETKFERQYDRAYATWTRCQDRQRRASVQKVDAPQQEFSAPAAAAAPPSPDLASNVQNVSHQQHPATFAAPGVAPRIPNPPGSDRNSVQA